MTDALNHKIFRIIADEAESQGVRAFVIGGYVRDWFLKRPCNDIDVVVEGSGIALAEAVAARVHAKVSVFRRFGTAMLRYQGMEADNSVFICFAPKDDPKIAIAAYIENAGFGATWACPIASLMVERYLTGEIRPERKYVEDRILQADLMSRVKTD